MSSIADLRPGMIGFGPIDGAARWPVWVGELLLGEGFTVGELEVEHVFVVTEVAGTDPGANRYPMCVEAMPSGAREWSIKDRWTDRYAYVMLPEDYPAQAADAAAIARAMTGTPYSFASYLALAAWRFGWKTDRLEAWINQRKPAVPLDLHDPDREQSDMTMLPRQAICSVLADQAWALTGKQVMPAGTPHQCVTPGALAGHLLNGMPGVQWLWPA